MEPIIRLLKFQFHNILGNKKIQDPNLREMLTQLKSMLNNADSHKHVQGISTIKFMLVTNTMISRVSSPCSGSIINTQCEAMYTSFVINQQ